jgi:dephospho-CoA kinase
VAVQTINKKPIIGILGGICSGKSSVAAEFVKLGCIVIDADKMAKQLLDEPAVQLKIITLFDTAILGPEGKIDRQKLARIVFSDPSKLAALTDIIHPPVLEKTSVLIEKYMMNPAISAIVLDMPLLVEVGWEKRCNSLVFVDCDPKIRLRRAENRGFFDENELKARENFQISLDKKRQISDYIIRNDLDLSELAQQVGNIFNCIMKNA